MLTRWTLSLPLPAAPISSDAKNRKLRKQHTDPADSAPALRKPVPPKPRRRAKCLSLSLSADACVTQSKRAAHLTIHQCSATASRKKGAKPFPMTSPHHAPATIPTSSGHVSNLHTVSPDHDDDDLI